MELLDERSLDFSDEQCSVVEVSGLKNEKQKNDEKLDSPHVPNLSHPLHGQDEDLNVYLPKGSLCEF